MTPAVERLLRAAEDEARRGDLEGARRSCERVLQQAPTLLPALKLQAALLIRSGAADAALAALRRVLARDPGDLESLVNAAALVKGRGQPAEAIPFLERALALAPSRPEIHYNLGNALIACDRPHDALASFDAALRLSPRLAHAHNNRGSVLKGLGRAEEACESFTAAVACDPSLSSARNNLGIALARRGDWPQAIRELEEAVRLNPSNLESRGELANALAAAGEYPRAFAAFQAAMALAPEHAVLWYNLGVSLLTYGDYEHAIAVLGELLQRQPDDVDLLLNLAQALMRASRPGEAAAHLERVRALAPPASRAVPVLFFARMLLCDWREFEPLVAALVHASSAAPEDIPPLALTVATDDPAAQLAAARNHAQWLQGDRPAAAAVRRARRPGPLRVAYISPDFGDHPVAHSIVEVFERHDRARVEVIGVSIQRRRETAIGARIAAACDRLIDVAGRPDHDVAAQLQCLDVDIAVDLAGYTTGCRPRIFAARGARVQVGYLGYPGTSGSPWIDYLIADRDVIPPSAAAGYSERIAWLSGCFFPSDTTQAVDAAPTRASAGLPEDGVVFACMTKPVRILPDAFDAWMRVLAATQDSVLWLGGAGQAADTLRAHAAERGVDPLRLVFAQRVESRSAYLGRLALADFCIDTFPYAGHSTVRDSLWSGVPVLVREGRTFAARVAPSLLRSVGLGSWVAHDWVEFEALAIELARDPSRVQFAKAKLLAREKLPLFDMARLTAELETAYEVMLGRWQRGEEPAHFAVDGDAVHPRTSSQRAVAGEAV